MFKSFFIASLGLAAVVSCQPRDNGKSTPKKPQDAQEQTVASTKEDPKPEAKKADPASPTNSMVQVNATNQEFRQIQPWTKGEPSYSTGFAIYLGDGKFLTAANIVYEASYVDLRYPNKSRKVPAKVTAFDPEANLAILEVKNKKDADFVANLVPVEFGSPAKINDQMEIWQFNNEGLPLVTNGTLQATDFSSPFIGENGFTLYNIKAPITTIQGGAGNPVIKDGKLIGLSNRCNTENQQVFATTHTTLKSFLDQIKSGTYKGFPIDGLMVAELTDEVFRRYLGLPESGGGLYVSDLPKHGNFYQAGLRSGDVILAVNDIPLDALGMYQDANLGPVSCSTLLNEAAQIGDVIKLKVSRRQDDGKAKEMDLHVTLNRSALDKDIIDHQSFPEPGYTIYGGMTFTPLSTALIREIMNVTNNRMPPTLSDALKNKDKYQEDGVEEIVTYLFAIPTKATLGYDRLSPSIVESVNGVKVKSLKHLNELLDGPAQNNVHHLRINRSPYSMYISKDEADKANKQLQMSGIPELRKPSK